MRSSRRLSVLLGISVTALLLATSSGAFAQTSVGSLPARYEKWVDEDVHWIILPQEERSFRALKTDDERDHFVEQFWKRRDPTPATDKNEFKEEHYQRLAYANSHYAEGEPGWKTDRGHAYIMFGAPDQVEVLSNRSRPTQVWHYHNGPRDVPMTFVDDCACGEYHIRKD